MHPPLLLRAAGLAAAWGYAAAFLGVAIIGVAIIGIAIIGIAGLFVTFHSRVSRATDARRR